MAVGSLSEVTQHRHSVEFGSERVIDQAVIETLQAISGDDSGEFLLEVLELFLEDSAECMTRIQGASEQSDWETVGSALHSLKSASANVGALALAQACAETEAAVRQELVEELPGRALSLPKMLAEVQQVLTSLMTCLRA